MIKQQIYENILARRSGMNYIPGIQFQKIIINMDEVKELTMNNQSGESMDKKKRCRCGSLEHLHITSKDCPIGLSYQNAKKALDMGLSQQETKKSAADALPEAEKNLYFRGVIDE